MRKDDFSLCSQASVLVYVAMIMAHLLQLKCGQSQTQSLLLEWEEGWEEREGLD